MKQGIHPEYRKVVFLDTGSDFKFLSGWNKPNNADTNWREVRYLYKYNKDELMEWKQIVTDLAKSSKDIIVLFNNNSGGDAAGNAKELQDLLGITYKGLSPRQIKMI